jgi:hypothetical protein
MAEAARWGDYRRDVHRYQTAGPFALYKKDTHWMVQQNFILNTYFPQRTANFISQLCIAGLFPSFDAPVLYINGKIPDNKIAAVGDKITMTTTQGTIYYTTNGTDPVVWSNSNGTVNTKSAKLYSQSFTINQSVNVIARSFYNGKWSAATSVFFIVPENYQDIKITEIHYHPYDEAGIDNSEFEFIELKNTGTSTLDISGMKFTRGIDYIFPTETQLDPGAFIVLGTNSNHFLSRYKFRPFDIYKGKLDNAGERLTLISPFGTTIADFTYGTYGDWPSTPDGQGFSLVPTTFNPTGNQTDATAWRASHLVGGSPGADDVPVASVPEIINTKADNIFETQNFPNPFNNITYIDLNINKNAYVDISIFNIMGLKITTLCSEYKPEGFYQFEWKGNNIQGTLMPEGIYFYKINANSGSDCYEITRKMVLKR